MTDIWQTCFLISGVKVGDCAAWIQAVGSIFAILVAVGVAYWQRREDRRREDMRDMRESVRQMNVLISMAEKAVSPILELPERLDDEGKKAFKPIAALWDFTDGKAALEKIGPSDVPSGEALALMMHLHRVLSKASGCGFAITGADKVSVPRGIDFSFAEKAWDELPSLKAEAERILQRLREMSNCYAGNFAIERIAA